MVRRSWIRLASPNPDGIRYAVAETGSASSVSPLVVDDGHSSWGGSRCDRRRSCSSRVPAGVMVRPRHPVEERSSTAQARLMALVSPGNRPMTLVRPYRFPEASLDEIWVSNASMMGGREPQIGHQASLVGDQDLHGRRIQVDVFGGERGDPFVDDLDQLGSGLDGEVGGVENGPVAAADRCLHPDRNLGQDIAYAANRHLCRNAFGKICSMAAIRPLAPSETTGNGVARPRSRRA